MLPLSYNISYELKKKLDSIDELRARILLTPLQPKHEQKMKWDYLVKHLHYAFLLNGELIDIPTIVKALKVGTKPSKNKPIQYINSYRRALNYLYEEWIANPSLITSKTAHKLLNIVTNSERTNSDFQNSLPTITHLLEYLQTQPDHPVVLAAIAYIKILDILPSVPNNILLAQLTAFLFLYKYGFDIKEMVSFEGYFYKNLNTYHEVIRETLDKNRLTLWMEYFAVAIEHELLKVAQHISTTTLDKSSGSQLWKLSERQKDILHKVEEPGITITNRSVQKMFGISQITASRDLAKLSTLGLLLVHGKGRSVYYIKA